MRHICVQRLREHFVISATTIDNYVRERGFTNDITGFPPCTLGKVIMACLILYPCIPFLIQQKKLNLVRNGLCATCSLSESHAVPCRQHSLILEQYHLNQRASSQQRGKKYPFLGHKHPKIPFLLLLAKYPNIIVFGWIKFYSSSRQFKFHKT